MKTTWSCSSEEIGFPEMLIHNVNKEFKWSGRRMVRRYDYLMSSKFCQLTNQNCQFMFSYIHTVYFCTTLNRNATISCIVPELAQGYNFDLQSFRRSHWKHTLSDRTALNKHIKQILHTAVHHTDIPCQQKVYGKINV